MNQPEAVGAYRNSLLATGDAKAVEAAAFAQVNFELSNAMRRRETDWPGYVAALSKNLQLWTTISADIMNRDNKLPDETRGKLLSLAKFVRTRSMEIFKGGKDADAGTLLDINANIAAGLRGVVK